MQKKLTIILFALSITASYPLGMFDTNFVVGGDVFAAFGSEVQQIRLPAPRSHYGSYGRERAILESEGKLSQLDSKYTYAHNFVADIIGHKPIIDTIQDHEKYGNDGEQSRKFAKAIVGGFDGVANVVNRVLDAPYEKASQLSRTATAALNAVGASFVGL